MKPLPQPTELRRPDGNSDIASVQWLRALAALSVVAYHAGGKSQFTAGGAAGVDVFFIISGFIMWVTTAARPLSPAEFMWRRLIRIVPAYWVFTTILLFTAIALPTLFSKSKVDWPHVAASYAFIPWMLPSDGWIAPLLVQGWTLNYEMFFYAIFALFLLINSENRALAVTAVLGGLVAAGLYLAPQGAIAKTYTSPQLLQFAAGIWLGKVWLAGRVRFPAPIAAGMVALGIFVLWWVGAASLQMNAGTEALVRGILALLIVAGGLSLENHVRGWPALGRILGDASYSIYLVNLMLISVCNKLWAKTHLTGKGADTLFVFAMLVLSCLAGWLCFRLIELPSLRVLRGWRASSRVSAADPIPSLSSAVPGFRPNSPLHRLNLAVADPPAPDAVIVPGAKPGVERLPTLQQ